MRSIRGKIITVGALVLACAMIVLGITACFLTYKSTTEGLKKSMKETAVITGDRIKWEIRSYQNIAAEAGEIAELSNPEIPVEEKQKIIDQRVKAYGFRRGNVLGADGKSIFDSNDYSEREYFQAALKGETFISDPLVSKVTGELTIIIAAPLWKDGVAGSESVGAVYFVPEETFLNDIMATINISEHSGAYMINKDGNTIADVTIDTVKKGQNIEQEANSNSKLKELAALHKDMRAGNAGFAKYSSNSGDKFFAYAPVEGTNGWSVGISSSVSDYMDKTYETIIITIIILALSFAVGFIVLSKLANDIGKSIKQCSNRLKLLAEGDLHTEVVKSKSKDETAVLNEATEIIVKTMNGMIGGIDRILTEISNGNLDVAINNEFSGDFGKIEELFKKLLDELNDTMTQINESAEQVSGGSDQVSAGAQMLAQGTTEQASSVEELSATICDITNKIKNNADNLQNADSLIVKNSEEINICNRHMQELTSAMNKISKASEEINNIIATINNIAFQTNILALNAAVEAARAGEAGKSFSVVAEEVRNLAQRSAKAAQNTTQLIQDTISAIENGIEITGDTARSLAVIVENSDVITREIRDLTNTSNEQAIAVEQVSQGVEQISGVVQSNAATAEESAATSHELSGQADKLKELVNKFNLKNDSSDWYSGSEKAVFSENEENDGFDDNY